MTRQNSKHAETALFDTEAINSANPLPALVEKLTGETLGRSSGLWKTLCPFHDEKTPSFHVWDDHAHCFGCHTHISDSIDFVMKLKEISFGEACQELGGDTSLEPITRTNRPQPKPEPPKLPPNFWDIERKARAAVYNSDSLKNRVAEHFGVSARTVEKLTFTPGASIGFRAQPTFEKDGERRPCSPNRLVYTYPSGIKIRTPFGPDSKCRFLWEYGRAELPWRAFMLRRDYIRTVHISEGESDSITLINEGMEDIRSDSPSCVVAAPGTGFKSEWAPLFAGKTVVIWFDEDGNESGQRAIERAVTILKPYVREIIVRNFGRKALAG
jgi:hypothetical protein